VKILVLDEADRMLDMGFWPDVRRILRLLPSERQNMLFSATLSEPITRVVNDMLHDPITIDVAPESATVENVTQLLYAVNPAQKTELLVALLKEIAEYRAIIFTRTKRRADRLTEALNSSGVEAAVIHSDLSQEKRTKTLDSFRNGTHSLLVSTDVTARGIDIDGVTHVINYAVPDRPEDYVHRIGRTARAGESGVAMTLMAYEEMPQLRDIERMTGLVLENCDVEGFSYLDRVIPNAERVAKGATRSAFSGGVMRRGGRKRTRRF
jgi:ATP-dependent RNA helicase RhlE